MKVMSHYAYLHFPYVPPLFMLKVPLPPSIEMQGSRFILAGTMLGCLPSHWRKPFDYLNCAQLLLSVLNSTANAVQLLRVVRIS